MSDKISIRLASVEDGPALLALYAPYVEHTAVTFEYEVPTAEEFARRIQTVEKRFPYLVAERDGVIVGYTYVSPFKERVAYAWSVETSIYVAQDRRRQGIGMRLYRALEQVLQVQGILNLNACVAYPRGEDAYLTQDSVRFHEKLGYRTVGRFQACGYKFHHWYDMVWMEKHIGEHREHQPAVRAFSEVADLVRERYGIC